MWRSSLVRLHPPPRLRPLASQAHPHLLSGSRGFFTGNLHHHLSNPHHPLGQDLAQLVPLQHSAKPALVLCPPVLKFHSSLAASDKRRNYATSPQSPPPQHAGTVKAMTVQGADAPMRRTRKIASLKEMLRSKGASGTLDLDAEMWDIVRSSSSLTERELSLLINLAFTATKNGLEERELLAHIIMATRMRDLSVEDCSKLIWCLAKINVVDRLFFNFVTSKVSRASRAEFSPAILCHLLWAFTRLGISEPTPIRHILKADFAQFSSEELVYVLWSVSRTSYLLPSRWQRTIRRALREVMPKLDTLRPYTFGTLMVSLNVANLDYTPFLRPLASYSLLNFPHFTQQTVAELALFLSTIRRQEGSSDLDDILPELWRQLELRIVSDLELFSIRELAHVGRALVDSSGMFAPKTFEVVSGKIVSLLPTLGQHELCTIIYELSRCRSSLPEGLTEDLATILLPRVSGLSPHNLVNVVVSCCKLFHVSPSYDLEWSISDENEDEDEDIGSVNLSRPPDNPVALLFPELEKGLRLDLPLLSPEMLATVAQSLALANRATPELFKELGEHVERALPGFQPFLLSRVLVAFTRARLRHPPLLRACLNLALQQPLPTPAYFCTLFTAAVENDAKNRAALINFLAPAYLNRFTSSQLTCLLWLFCCLNLERPPQLDLVIRALEEKAWAAPLSPADATLFHLSLSYLSFGDPEAVDFLRNVRIRAPPRAAAEITEPGPLSLVEIRKREIVECLRALHLPGVVNYVTPEGVTVDVGLEKYHVCFSLLSRGALVKDLETGLNSPSASESTRRVILERGGWRVVPLRAQLWRRTSEQEKLEVLKKLLAQNISKGANADEVESDS